MDDRSTRDRLIDQALRLFAERGYRGATVGDIEAAAGLAPRSGGLYKHFASKREVLVAALERHIGSLEGMHSVMDLLPLADLRSELTLLVRWALQELAQELQLIRIIQRDGHEFPELRDRFRDLVARRGYQEAAEWMRRKIKEGGFPDYDCDAAVAVLLGAVVHYRVEEATFGAPPADVDEERFVETWVDVCMRLAESA